ncbi:MAG: DNA adenine methylase [Anaerolineales bacterium]|nr:DNA adenine methylase [Anaerolineales bacterium]
MKITSPLRYPGGKTKALKQILPLIPEYEEFREPFVGGGSVFIACKQTNPNALYWINDLNQDLYLFWKYAQKDLDRLVESILDIKKNKLDGRELFNSYKNNWDSFGDFDRAVRFFVLNRITFSGTIDSGGYSQQSFAKRFTDTSIERLSNLKYILDGVKITNLDYVEVINQPGSNVFIFLDPPYYSTTQSRLYGKKGDLHQHFDHQRFADYMRKCDHKWLITYDDCLEVRELFNFAYLVPWNLQYGMNNFKQGSAGIGQELFISNYPLEKNSTSTQLKLFAN